MTAVINPKKSHTCLQTSFWDELQNHQMSTVKGLPLNIFMKYFLNLLKSDVLHINTTDCLSYMIDFMHAQCILMQYTPLMTEFQTAAAVTALVERKPQLGGFLDLVKSRESHLTNDVQARHLFNNPRNICFDQYRKIGCSSSKICLKSHECGNIHCTWYCNVHSLRVALHIQGRNFHDNKRGGRGRGRGFYNRNKQRYQRSRGQYHWQHVNHGQYNVQNPNPYGNQYHMQPMIPNQTPPPKLQHIP